MFNDWLKNVPENQEVIFQYELGTPSYAVPTRDKMDLGCLEVEKQRSTSD